MSLEAAAARAAAASTSSEQPTPAVGGSVNFNIQSWFGGTSAPAPAEAVMTLSESQPPTPTSSYPGDSESVHDRNDSPEGLRPPGERNPSRKSFSQAAKSCSQMVAGRLTAPDVMTRKNSRISSASGKAIRSRLSADHPRANRRHRANQGDQQSALLARQQNTYSYAQRRSLAMAARSIADKSQASNFRRFLPGRRQSSSTLADASKHDSYKFDGEESKVHFDRRTSLPENHRRNVRIVSTLIVVAIGAFLGCLAAGMNLAVYYIATVRPPSHLPTLPHNPDLHHHPSSHGR